MSGKYINQGSLWPNKYKESDEDKKPHYTGEQDVDGLKYKLAMWVNRNPEGRQPTFKLKIELKEGQISEGARTNGMTQLAGAFNDDVPF